MKVVFQEKTVEFDAITDFLEYLTLQETEENSNDRLTLTIDEMDFSENDFKSLLAFLHADNRISLFQITISVAHPHAEKYNALLLDVYLASQREFFTKTTMKQEMTWVALQPDEAKLRKAKVDLVRGVEPLGCQIQHQQQQQQEQQQQTTQVITRRIRKSRLQAEGEEDLSQLPSLGSFGNLVIKHNIHIELGTFTKQLYSTPPDLFAVWDGLVGPGSEKIADKKRTITRVQVKAMEQIIRHYPQFSDGIVFDNLPAGFYLQYTQQKHNVLCYSEDTDFLQQQALKKTPLTLQLRESSEPLVQGTYRQFLSTFIMRIQPNADENTLWAILHGRFTYLLKDFPSLALYPQKFQQLTEPSTSDDIKKEAFLFFISELTQNNLEFQKHLVHLLEVVQPNYQCLTYLLISHGEQGVLLFLQEMVQLKDKGMYENFNDIILANAKDYSQFLNESNLNNFKIFKRLDSAQQAWWESLVKQHAEAGNPVDFEELFEAYHYFLEEIRQLGLSQLPFSCPITPIKHLKIALDRTLTILKNAADPKEQLVCLRGLDFGANGSVYAIHDGYALVAKAMCLTPFSDLDQSYDFPERIPYSKSWDFSLHIGMTKSLFDRQEYAYRISPSSQEYKEILKRLEYRLSSDQGDFGYELAFYKYQSFLLHQAMQKVVWDAIYLNDHIMLCNSWSLNDGKIAHHENYYLINPSKADRYKEPIHSVAIPGPSVDGFRKISPFLNYLAPVKQSFFSEINTFEQGESYDLQGALKTYYRYMGMQDSAYPLEVYQEIAQFTLHENQLTAKEKAYFLAVVAISATDNIESETPVEDAKKLFAILLDIDKRYKSAHQGSFVFKLKEIACLSANQMLSLQQLAYLAKCLSFVSEEEISQCMRASIQLIQTAAPHEAYVFKMMDALKKREQIFQQQVTDIPYPGYGKFILFLEKCVDSLKDDLVIGQWEKQVRYELIAMLPLLADSLSSDEEKDREHVLALAHQLERLDLRIRMALLSVLSTINIEQSQNLPSMGRLQQLIKELGAFEKQAFDELPAIKMWVEKRLSGVVFGDEPAQESLINLMYVLRDNLSALNILKLFDALSEATKGLKPVKEAYAQLEMSLTREPIELENVFISLMHFEKKMGSFFEDPLINFVLSHLPKESLPSSISDFKTKKKLLGLLKSPIENYFLGSLERSMRALQIQDESLFHLYLMEYLGGLDDALPLDMALLSYSQRAYEMNAFLNALIGIKKKVPHANFRKLMSALESHNTYESLSLISFEILFRSLEEAKNPPIHVQFNILLDVLKDSEVVYVPERLPIALEQVRVLVELSSRLSLETYQTLLKKSFIYNLTSQGCEFPLEKIVALNTIVGIHPKQAEDLFLQFLALIERAPEEMVAGRLQGTLTLLVNTVQSHAVSTPQVTLLVTHLLKQCLFGNEEELVILQRLFTQMPSEGLNDWMLIMGAIASDNLANLNEMLSLQQLLERHVFLLPQIASLFEYRPYPSLSQLLVELTKDSKSVQHYVTHYDLDPKTKRQSVEDIKHQFSEARILPVVQDIEALLEGQRLSREKQYELVQQLIYINAIGKEHPVKMGEETIHDLTQISRAQLARLSQHLIHELCKAPDSTEKVSATQLKLIAVLREIYFRSTGKFPHTAQLASLLISLNYPENLLMEINTGEGKSITTALLAVLQWTKGSTVDVCTANRELVHQDYEDKGTVDFFNFLKIPSAMVFFDSEPGTYQPHGINYSTVADMSLYRARAGMDGELLKIPQNKKDLILDESDYNILDNRTFFNYAMGSDGGVKNPWAWVYPLINEFVNHHEFQNLDSQKGAVWVKEEDIKRLKIFLDEQALSSTQRNQLMTLSDSRFNKWLNSSCIAQQQKLGIHFVIHKEVHQLEGEERQVSVAVPLIQNIPQYGATFSDGVQQFLQAHLQQKQPQLLFPIESEMMFVATQSAKDFVSEYLRQGRILGISGTVGTHEELLEQQMKFAVNAFNIPSQAQNRRKVFEPRLLPTAVAQVNDIKKIIQEAKSADKSTAPILIIAKDIQHAHELHIQLRELLQGFEFNLVTGEESEALRQERIKRASQCNTITISTSLLGRGTDIEPTHTEGLLVVQAYLDTQRTTRQILGRAARNGQVGRYIAIYDENGFPHRHEMKSLRKMSNAARKKGLIAMQQRMKEERAIERYYQQEVTAIQQVMLQQFDNWRVVFEEILTTIGPNLKSKMLMLREDLITNLYAQWKIRLDESDVKKEFSNVFVRRNAEGRLQTEDLNTALAQLRNDALGIWESINQSLAKEAATGTLTKVNEFRVSYLKEQSLEELLKRRYFDLHKEQEEQLSLQQKAKTHSLHALDVNAAILRFTEEGVLSAEEKLAYQEDMAKTQLNLCMFEYHQVALPLDLTLAFQKAALQKSPLEKLAILADAHQNFAKRFSNHLAKKLKMQPVVCELLEVYEQLQKTHVISEEVKMKMDSLKSDYIEEVSLQLVTHLESSLSWAQEGQQSWDYWIERSAVKQAACHLLQLTAAFKTASAEEKASHLKTLYQALHKEKMAVKDLWIFSFGHQNTKKLIEKSLMQLSEIVQVAGMSQEIQFESQEAAVCERFLEGFSKLYATQGGKEADERWGTIVAELKTIQENNTSLYVFYELQACLNRHYEALHQTTHKTSLLQPLTKLRHQLMRDINHLEHEYPHLLSAHHFLRKTEVSLLKQLNQLDGIAVDHLALKEGHTGFSTCYTLTFKGSVEESALLSSSSKTMISEMSHYNDSLKVLFTEKESLSSQLRQLQEHLQDLGSQAEEECFDALKETQDKIQALQKHLNFINEEIKEEQLLGGVYHQRFDNLEALFKFVGRVRSLSNQQDVVLTQGIEDLPGLKFV